jgi:hypothetical protein
MNNLKNGKYLIVLFLISCFFTSCQKPDGDKEYGFPVIYMPQSTLYSGGLNNNYPVPGGTATNPNYTIDKASGKVEIILGVYRAGTQVLEGYSVDIYEKADTASQIVNSGIVKDGVLLPSDLYSFPTSVSVPNGSREATFHLTIDGAKLNSKYPELAGKTLVMAIAIKNPSKYELNEPLSTTVVLIAASSFMPLPQ